MITLHGSNKLASELERALAVDDPTGNAEFRTAANYMCPAAPCHRLVIAITMLVSSDDKLATGFLEQRPPKIRTGALPSRIVG